MDRKLILDHTYPCKLEEYLLPNKIDWRFNISNYDGLTKHDLNIGYDDKFIRFKLPLIDFTNYYKNTDIIIVSTGFNLIKHLTLNTKHHEKIKLMGYSIEEFNIESLYFKWIKILFKFNINLQKKYNKMLELSNPNNETNLICVQIRIGGLNGELLFTSESNTKKYWDFLRSKFDLTNSKIFITTDREEVIDESIKEFGNKTIIAFKNRSFNIHHIKHYKSSMKECNNIGELYIDFFFLGECNMGIISHSGFGFFGIMNRLNRNDLKNFYVFTNPKKIKKNNGDRNNLSFYQFNYSMLYLEKAYQFIPFPNKKSIFFSV